VTNPLTDLRIRLKRNASITMNCFDWILINVSRNTVQV